MALSIHMLALTCCFQGSLGVKAGGSVVRIHSGELALKMPMDPLSITEQVAPLLDIRIHSGVSSPEAAADTKLTLSVDENRNVHLYKTGEKHQDKSWTPLAWADYKNTVAKNGWGYLSVKASVDTQVSNDLKMYAAGFLEGFTTGKQIRDFQHNANALIKKQETQHSAIQNIRDLFAREVGTVCKQGGVHTNGTVLSNANQATDPWWQHARLILLQGFGIMDAYNLHAANLKGKPMSFVDLMVLNSDGETPELEMAYDFNEVLLRQDDGKDDDDLDATAFMQERTSVKRTRNRRGTLEPSSVKAAIFREKVRRKEANRRLRANPEAEWRRIKKETGRCSALVRLAANNSDVFVGHTTFSDYSEMNRIWKYYDFPLGPGVNQLMGFSSYPGVASSTDDYYLMSSGLVVTETTVSMLSDSAFDKLNESSFAVPDFMRIMISNKLAKNGKEWVDYMTKSATGTYNSQWMVLDYNLFTPNEQLKNGTLWVLEQAPGVSVSMDESSRLQHEGFWASENRGTFASIRKISGEEDAEQSIGEVFSASHNPRAKIFAKTAPSVNLLADMRHEMQRNRWPNEVGVGRDDMPDHAIAARGDLAPGKAADPNGGVDSKVTNACLAKKLSADAIAGPTHDGQKPFRWTDGKGKDLFPDYPRDGLPDEWNFDWVRMTPHGEEAITGSCA
mmetsp:Transcript_26259/g.50328  ORF Transcript_26259/g.50328 Transcript_26259/m.50328 type:complete len:676 (+) Transcript_26259:53-2080(+)